MRFCPHCLALYRGDFAHCPADGAELASVEAGGPDPLLGRAVDRFRFEALLGEGSTGRVYEAVHRTREERFAVKLIWGDLAADRRLLRRFERASEATSVISHRNVVPILEVATSSTGPAFLVMPMVRGRSLRRIVDEDGRLGPAEVVRIAEQLAEGLDAAHEAGFVHRDVKPANLVLDAEGVLHILDFGLVGLTVAEADARITASGTFVGTPLYMAPEQARNPSGVSPAADVYGLGVVLFELLTGLPPFRGQTPMEVMIAHSTQEPPPLPPSGGLEQLVAWCLEKRPELRPHRARVVASELSRILTLMAGAAPAPAQLTETLELDPIDDTLDGE